MKITDIKTFFVDPGVIKNGLFVKVETDEGISGWGEAYNYRDRAMSTAAHANSMKQYLIGRSPFNIKHFTQVMFDDYAGRRGSMGFFCIISGIEQALWDIVGKTLNTPVYNLLGGACRCWSMSLQLTYPNHTNMQDEVRTKALSQAIVK